MLLLALLALTLPVFLSCWLMSGTVRGAVRGWAEVILPTAAVMAAAGVLGALWAWMDFMHLL